MDTTINRVQELTQNNGHDTNDKEDLILLTRKLRKYIDNKNNDLSKSVKELVEQVKLLRQEQKFLKDYCEFQSATLRKDLFEKALSQFASQEVWLNKKLESPGQELDSHSKSFAAGADAMLENLKSFFKMMPVPQVMLPDGAIKVLQDAPNIHVTVAAPDKAFKVDVAPTVVQIPKDALKVTYKAPEQPPPEVKVEVKNRPMEKTFTYYPDGRPEKVTEKYLDEDID